MEGFPYYHIFLIWSFINLIISSYICNINLMLEYIERYHFPTIIIKQIVSSLVSTPVSYRHSSVSSLPHQAHTTLLAYSDVLTHGCTKERKVLPAPMNRTMGYGRGRYGWEEGWTINWFYIDILVKNQGKAKQCSCNVARGEIHQCIDLSPNWPRNRGKINALTIEVRTLLALRKQQGPPLGLRYQTPHPDILWITPLPAPPGGGRWLLLWV